MSPQQTTVKSAPLVKETLERPLRSRARQAQTVNPSLTLRTRTLTRLVRAALQLSLLPFTYDFQLHCLPVTSSLSKDGLFRANGEQK